MPELPWRGDEVERKIRAKIVKKLEAACIVLKTEWKQMLVQLDNITGRFPSLPGEPPAKVTGTLSGRATHEVDKEKLIGRVGASLPYLKWLEEGTRYMASRPSLKPALKKATPKIKEILGVK